MSSLSSFPDQIPNSLFDNNHYFSMIGFSGTGDGDLQAVVRGYCSSTNGFSTATMDDSSTNFAPYAMPQEDDYPVFSTDFPDLFEETTTVLNELEELYKPFYPQTSLLSPTTSSSSISGSRGEEEIIREPEKVLEEKDPLSGSPAPAPANIKYKRRKTGHKRVVIQATAEDLSSDMWAWRKYGQKPIKGSPHPRSYYRCSSSKGCPARKQVERSRLDPEMFVITYTAEHCHGQPTRRSSLAGTTRHKLSIPKSSTCTTTSPPPTMVSKLNSGSSPISSTTSADHLSPPTHSLATTMEDEQQNGLVICDSLILGDDFFAGFDELIG